MSRVSHAVVGSGIRVPASIIWKSVTWIAARPVEPLGSTFAHFAAV